MMAVAPGMVREARIAEADDPDRTGECVFAHPVNRTSLNGVTGSPSAATREAGEELFAWMVEDLSALIERGMQEMPPLPYAYHQSITEK